VRTSTCCRPLWALGSTSLRVRPHHHCHGSVHQVSQVSQVSHSAAVTTKSRARGRDQRSASSSSTTVQCCAAAASNKKKRTGAMYHKRGILDLLDKSPCKILHAADRRRRRLLRTKTAPQSVWRPQPRPRWDALSAVRHAPRCATSLGSGRVYAGRAGQPAGLGGLSGAAGLATLPEHPILRRGGAAARGGGARAARLRARLLRCRAHRGLCLGGASRELGAFGSAARARSPSHKRFVALHRPA
jgi:hypothetical protein